MPLRTAAKLCPQAIFVDGHPDRYRECSRKSSQSPRRVFTAGRNGFDRRSLSGHDGHRAPARAAAAAAHTLHQRMKAETELNCSIGIGSSRLIAKVSSDQAKPNGVLWIVPGAGSEISGAARCARNSRRRQGHGENLHALGIRKVGDLARSRNRSGRAIRKMGTRAWPARRAAKMPAAGSTAKSEPIKMPSPSATNTHTTKTPRTSPSWSPR